MKAIEATLRRSIALASIACVGMTAAGVLLLSIGADEAWLTLSALRIAGASAPVGSFAPTVTSGGAFLALHALAGAIGGEAVPLHRALTLAGWLAGLALVWRIATRDGGSRWAGWIAIACVLSTPGALVLGAASHAESLSFLVVLLAWLAWEATEGRRALRCLGCGALVGLAAATRTPAIFFAPALVAFAAIDAEGRRARLQDALAAGAIAGVVFAALTGLYLALSPVAGDAHKTLMATGVEGLWIDYVRLFNKWLIGGELMPVAGTALVAAGVFLTHERGRRGDARPLVIFAALIWAFWVLRSPIPHVRYLWPALPCLWLSAGLTAGRVHDRAAAGSRVRVASLAFALACVGWQAGLDLRALALGDVDQLAWEGSREMEISSFRAFQAARDQRAVAAYLRESAHTAGAPATLGLSYPLRWASGTPVSALLDAMQKTADGKTLRWSTRNLPRRLILGPTLGTYRHLDPRAWAWFETNCALERQFGAYAVYRVVGGYPDDPAILYPRSEAMRNLPLARPPFADRDERARQRALRPRGRVRSQRSRPAPVLATASASRRAGSIGAK